MRPPPNARSARQLKLIADVADALDDGDDLEIWTRFHEAVLRLPVLEREVICLSHYHGWTQKQIAELFDLSLRKIQLLWESAKRKLRRILTVVVVE